MPASLPGPPEPGDGMAAAVRCAAPSLPASNTAFVISSTNRGMPSVRSIMSCRMSAGRSLLPTTRSIIALMSRSASRLMPRNVTYARPTQGDSKSGLNVTISSTRTLRTRSTTRPNTSKLVGSVQCASSKIISTGFWRVIASIWEMSAPSVLCRRCSGVISSAG